MEKIRKKMNNNLEKKLASIESVARDLGLDYFPVEFEIVSQDVMLEILSYGGLPSRSRHWSHGQAYDYQKINGEMGYSKVFELVNNNDPAYAFLLDTNPDIVQYLVMAHVLGHSHYFKNNFLFQETDRNMVSHAAERAQRVDDYIEKYGLNAVEHIMDIGFALEKHIDWHKGLHRDKYGKRRKVNHNKRITEFDDLLREPGLSVGSSIVNDKFPPSAEFDLLWFIINYAPLEDWEQDILQIIREESFYFYPQYHTKTKNEGLAVLVHAEIMHKLDDLSMPEHLEFCKVHERVVQPGSNKLNINPYYLGSVMLEDIKKRWDLMHQAGESKLNGWEKVYDVVAHEDDVSFIRNYLTQEVVDDLEMFAYKTFKDNNKNEIVEITSRNVDDVAENLVMDLQHYRAPLICITKAGPHGMELEHHSTELGTLDPRHLERVMGYLFELWHSPIDLATRDNKGEQIHYTYDEVGFSADEEITTES